MIADCIVIGGGASGLMAACRLCAAGKSVILFEKQARVGRKLLSTGNGRCNLTNLNASQRDYHGEPERIAGLLRRYPPEAIRAYFRELGVETFADGEGRVYPKSEQASSVLDALRLYASERGCDIRTESPVKSVKRIGNIWQTDDGTRAQSVLIACGGLAAPKLGACADGYALLKAFGHEITPRLPAIAPLKTPAEPIRGLKGVRMTGEIRLISNGRTLRSERGEILFGDSGISGIAAMQTASPVSRASGKCSVVLRALPDEPDCGGFLRRRAERLPQRRLEDFLSGIVHKRLGQAMLRAAGIEGQDRPVSALTEKELCRLADVLDGWQIPVTGTAGFDAAQVTAGGASLRQFDTETMESRLAPGLYAAGEVLNIDGDCGGFNLHWAWISALAASDAILSE